MKNSMKSIAFLILISVGLSACLNDGNLLDNISGDEQAQNSETMIQLYEVHDGTITLSSKGQAEESWMENTDRHTEMWNFYKAFSTKDNLDWINEFEVYDGEGSEFGYVVNLDEDLHSWRLGLAIDGAYADGLNGNGELAHTVIHEQFHILSLNSTQLDTDNNACDYQNQEGCAREESYLDDFVDAFWGDILEEHQKINPNNQNKLYRFYEKYETQFVNDYAATNPEEDIAESFTYFVKNDETQTGSLIRDKKVKHFYQYPELVELRSKIRMSGFNLGKAKLGVNAHKHRNCRHKKAI